MRVAILTQPLGHNYGGLLQAYALQTYLRSIGCEVETLDRRSSDQPYVAFKRNFLNIVKLLLGRAKSIQNPKKQALVLKHLVDFRDRRIVMSRKISTEQEIRDYFREHSFDAVIVGSDQVWRPRYSPSIMNFYLDFLNDLDNTSTRIAYAASFGVDCWEYPGEITDKCSALAKQFDAISVREQSALKICQRFLGVSATCVVDPTLLLNSSDYYCLIEEADGRDYKDCVLSYVLDHTDGKGMVAKNIGDLLESNVISIKPEKSIEQVRNIEINRCIYPKVEEWVHGFHDAKFVVTDSFHGTLFAILFNKPFICIGNSTRGLARFESLLSHFALESRLVKSPQEISLEMIQQKIDWDHVNKVRENLAEKSKKFISMALKSV